MTYLLRCRDGSLYCGATNDMERRLAAHGRGRVKYTRGRLPVELAHTEPARDRSEALRREAAWKRLSRLDKLRLITGALAIFMIAAGGCGGSTPPTTGQNFQQLDAQIFQPTCTLSSCHSPQGASASNNLDLGTDAYAALVNVPAVNAAAAAAGLVRVKPCDPDHSLLWIKLNLPLDQTSSYGASMPLDNPHLLPAQLSAIHDWIARGAHPTEPAGVSGTTCTMTGSS